MENEIKCLSGEHKDIIAIKYCPECKIYMCKNVKAFIHLFSKIIILFFSKKMMKYLLDFAKKKIIAID